MTIRKPMSWKCIAKNDKMQHCTTTLPVEDDLEIFVAKWIPNDPGKICAALQIVHGDAEHGGNYIAFAEVLTEAGFAVYADDHRGFGKTAGSIDKLEYLAESNGWFKVVDDLYKVSVMIKGECPGVPLFMLGHSTGSLFSRTYLYRHGREIDGLILSGTCGNPGIMGLIGLILGRLMVKFQNPKKVSMIGYNLTKKRYNEYFKPNKTPFDWYTRDMDAIKKYMRDPYCGHIFTNQLFLDILTGLTDLFKKNNMAKIPRNIPILLFGGDKDPFAKKGKGIEEVSASYKKLGVKDVTTIIYPDGRHEMLQEINRNEVYRDITNWLFSKLNLLPDSVSLAGPGQR
ncbi:MAG: alpha/beta hydrolase [Oligoflexales bacterium]|nr:alpha/beta hydrolase [Oligoflexales bacterium]